MSTACRARAVLAGQGRVGLSAPPAMQAARVHDARRDLAPWPAPRTPLAAERDAGAGARPLARAGLALAPGAPLQAGGRRRRAAARRACSSAAAAQNAAKPGSAPSAA